MTGTWRFPLLVAVVITGLALGYSLLLSLGVVDYARNTIRYYSANVLPRKQALRREEGMSYLVCKYKASRFPSKGLRWVVTGTTGPPIFGVSIGASPRESGGGRRRSNL